MMKSLYLMLFFLTGAFYAQNHQLGSVTVAELLQKAHPSDSSAVAAVLFRKQHVYFKVTVEGRWKKITEMEVKIKIYKKEGYDYANFQRTYYSGSSNNSIKFEGATTYNLVNGTVEKTKLQKDGMFTQPENNNWTTEKISLPNIREGSVIEYKYTYATSGVSSLSPYYFEEEIPVDYSQYRVDIPYNFNFNTTSAGYLTPIIKTGFGVQANVDGKWTTFTLSNIKAFKDEKFVNNIDNYRTKVTMELASSISDGVTTKYATTWTDVVKEIYDEKDFGIQLEKNGYFKKDIDLLLENITAPEEKAAAIYDFVQSRMTWDLFGGSCCNKGVITAYKSNSGNIAEINLMLVSMFRYAGLNANPVLVSTRGNGIYIFPSSRGFNYVIAALETPLGRILYDASNKNSQPNILPIKVLNGTGWLIEKSGDIKEVELMPKLISKENVTIMASINSDGKVLGKIRTQYLDYNAFAFRERFLTTTEDYVLKLEKELNNIEISDYSTSHEKELAKPIIESYSFASETAAEVIGDKIYFAPMFFAADKENPFKQEHRAFPVDFVYPTQEKYTINVTLPDGYIVESFPKTQSYLLEDFGSFTFNISTSTKQIQLSVAYEMKKPIILRESYENLKVFFKEIIAKQNEKIILKKV